MTSVDPAVREYLDGIAHPVRRRDAETLFNMMGRVTGEAARMWGTSIVGFGQYHYKYESGREGDSAAAGFSARKAASTVYLADGVGAHTDLLDGLGIFTTGVGCLYIKDLEDVDLEVLAEIIDRSYTALSTGTYTQRAREGTTPAT